MTTDAESAYLDRITYEADDRPPRPVPLNRCPDCETLLKAEPVHPDFPASLYCEGCDTVWTRDGGDLYPECGGCLGPMSLDLTGAMWVCSCGESMNKRGWRESNG